MAVMGNYDSAGIYYEGVLQMLRKLLVGLSEPLQKGKWLMVSSGSSRARAPYTDV